MIEFTWHFYGEPNILHKPKRIILQKMANKFQNKYRISSTRLQGYDYGNAGMYYITICTDNRAHYFGKIVKGKMLLSEIGKIAQIEWFKTLEIRVDMNLQLDAFVVMPNHIHGIIIIGDNEYNGDGNNNGANNDNDMDGCNDGDNMDGCNDGDRRNGRDAMHRVSTTYKNKFTPQSKNLASIMRGYKSSVTNQARIFGFEFNWQSRYYDHIIRNEKSFKQIRNYINNNPNKWNDDKFN